MPPKEWPSRWTRPVPPASAAATATMSRPSSPSPYPAPSAAGSDSYWPRMSMAATTRPAAASDSSTARKSSLLPVYPGTSSAGWRSPIPPGGAAISAANRPREVMRTVCLIRRERRRDRGVLTVRQTTQATRCPRDRCPRDRCPRDRCPRDRCPRDRRPRDRRPRDRRPRDRRPRDRLPRCRVRRDRLPRCRVRRGRSLDGPVGGTGCGAPPAADAPPLGGGLGGIGGRLGDLGRGTAPGPAPGPGSARRRAAVRGLRPVSRAAAGGPRPAVAGRSGLADVLELLGLQAGSLPPVGWQGSRRAGRDAERGVEVLGGRVGLLRLVHAEAEGAADHLPAGQVLPVHERDGDSGPAGPAG